MCAETVLYLLILLLTCVLGKQIVFYQTKKKRFVKVDNRGQYVYIGCF